jgi:hypothetical protein
MAVTSIEKTSTMNGFSVFFLLFVTSSLLQLSESFLVLPKWTTTTTTTTTRIKSTTTSTRLWLYRPQNAPAVPGSSTKLLAAGQTFIKEKEKEEDATHKKKQKRRTWEESYQLLLDYKERHGTCQVPAKYASDPTLGYWVTTQRRNRDKLTDDQRDKLDTLGFTWSHTIREGQWEAMFRWLERYAEANDGKPNVPTNAYHGRNKKLFRWVASQRDRKLYLSMEQRTKLDAIGLTWHGANQEKMTDQWNSMLQRLVVYKQEHGDCLVPYRSPLGRWVSTQRQLNRKGMLTEDRKLQLEDLGFTWKVRDALTDDFSYQENKWQLQYELLLSFYKEHGHCIVPVPYQGDGSLGEWVRHQRRNQKNGTLKDDRMQLLDEIGFPWSFDDQKEQQWREKCQELQRFKATQGHLRLPAEQSSLRTWTNRQRVQYRAGKMNLERKMLLDQLDFRWEIVEQ